MLNLCLSPFSFFFLFCFSFSRLQGADSGSATLSVRQPDDTGSSEVAVTSGSSHKLKWNYLSTCVPVSHNHDFMLYR